MDSSIIIVLAIILFILIILNNISKKNDTTEENQASCSQTTFGCCPNGVDSKINYYGSNCPGYRPGPGYQPVIRPYVPPNPITPYVPPNPIGGCSGTRYGCCPNNVTPKYDEQGSNCPGRTPYIPPKPIGGCSGTRYGCCPNNVTPKYNEQGTNCIIK